MTPVGEELLSQLNSDFIGIIMISETTFGPKKSSFFGIRLYF